MPMRSEKVPDSDAERTRLEQDRARTHNWKRFGPYLAERQWGTVREDYSADGNCWEYFPHDHARSRAYRFGEDGLLGFTDRECRLCFAFAFWNGRDRILKERLFGLTGPQGNHGEDVKEHYFYLDSTPTHSYTRALYKYPQAEFPYARLIEENSRRGRDVGEFEIDDTGVFDGERYFDCFVETAKVNPDDIVIRLSIHNRGSEPAPITVLPQLWFRNTWSWGRTGDGHPGKPALRLRDGTSVECHHPTLGTMVLEWLPEEWEGADTLFTENVTNAERLFDAKSEGSHRKDAFHDYVISGDRTAVDPAQRGTKFALARRFDIAGRGSRVFHLRLRAEASQLPVLSVDGCEEVLAMRKREADSFFASRIPASLSPDERNVMRQAYASLLFSKQYYHFEVEAWIAGDPAQPAPPRERRNGRNHDWQHAFMRDVISMPDKWEYPWFASWDLAFHMIPFAEIDPDFAKAQLILLLREWYMHPSGQIPAYEFAFGDVNPPVHAWAAWRVYKMSAPRGQRDKKFLSRVFQKLLLNFTWWVNRKDPHGRNLFSGGFLGLDNIGIFDRSKPLPTGGHLEQADGTAWMAFYCSTMLAIALELAEDDPAAEDLASKFLEHFVAIIDAMNHLDGKGLWDEVDGFYYDHLHIDGTSIPLKVRSMVGIIPLFAAEILEEGRLDRLPGFKKRFDWFRQNRPDLARHIVYSGDGHDGKGHYLISVPPRERLERVMRVVLDEQEFLSPHGVRSLSKRHQREPFAFEAAGERHEVRYVSGESESGLFGGNSNWRGPIWFPVNYLLVEALERYDHFYSGALRVELPSGSGRFVSLGDVARDLAHRLGSIFIRDNAIGFRPCQVDSSQVVQQLHFRDLLTFNEYFDGDSGRGCGASHQTGWTALVVRFLREMARARTEPRVRDVENSMVTS